MGLQEQLEGECGRVGLGRAKAEGATGARLRGGTGLSRGRIELCFLLQVVFLLYSYCFDKKN